MLLGGKVIMNKIITIGREFGSGGRELGKRIADNLKIAYYDKEIIMEISKKTSMAEEYVQQIVENKPIMSFPITIGNSFYPIFNPVVDNNSNIYTEQSNTLINMANKSDCVIIGRCADYVLEKYNPFKIFVYSDIDSKIKRCREKASKNEELSDKDLKHQILEIDRNRSKYYQFFTGKKWGDRMNYDLCVNTSNLNVKDIANFVSKILSKQLGS